VINDTNFSAAVTPVRRIVFATVPLVTGAVLTTTRAADSACCRDV
jgi:hypothetical protein